MRQFLRGCAQRVLSGESRFGMVLGNEAADLDSVVGSLYLAYFLSSTDAGRSLYPDVPLFLPVVNIPQSDLPLRGDVMHALLRFEVDPSDLFYCWPSTPGMSGALVDLSESWQRSASPHPVTLLLYDHNLLSTRQKHLQPFVRGIVDHHVDDKVAYGAGSVLPLRIVETVGSAATHVALLFQAANAEPPDPMLLEAPIMQDTLNYDKAMKKVTEKDVAARKFLESFLGVAATSAERSARFAELQRAKADVSHLTAFQALRRDLKCFEVAVAEGPSTSISLVVPSVLGSHDSIVRRYRRMEWLAAIANLQRETNCGAVVVMYAWQEAGQGLCREMLISVLFSQGERSQRLWECLSRWPCDPRCAACLGLASSLEETNDDGGCRQMTLFCKQKEATASRKQVVPTLVDYLQSASSVCKL